jgi:F-type H+-transporting ATPase subunit a
MSANPTTPLAADIKIGEHVQGHFLGMTFNLDTIWSTAIAGGIVLILGLIVARSASVESPGKIQIGWEAIVNEVHRQVEEALGTVNRYVIQLAIALFTFILISNWLELIPSGEHPKLLVAPTADVNLTYAMALLVIVGVHRYSVKRRGVGGYFHHYLEPYPALLPLTVLEEIVKPFTLALRLFGNIFAGGIMIAIIGLLPLYLMWFPNILWKGFDMFIGLIQAFIFALLTVLYFGIAGTTHDDEHGEEHGGLAEHAEPAPMTSDSAEKETAQPELSGAH